MPYYTYDPASVLENSALFYWDRTIITDRYITTNRPDIVLVDQPVRRAIIVDTTIPQVKAEKEKVSKYLDLAQEITAMWGVESNVIVPIVVSVTGFLAKSFDQYLKKLSLGCCSKSRIQKAVAATLCGVLVAVCAACWRRSSPHKPDAVADCGVYTVSADTRLHQHPRLEDIPGPPPAYETVIEENLHKDSIVLQEVVTEPCSKCNTARVDSGLPSYEAAVLLRDTKL
ncbi:jg5921 [Pararge aegeria aegeria]|uniref:Jg5921 protein n=1 Tax=Pararge aegeria aegeria TaxID=348720 RepID=A0A8S4RGN2_9NEOP|nr:jg5921 [Pararge aegeria aegeria]